MGVWEGLDSVGMVVRIIMENQGPLNLYGTEINKCTDSGIRPDSL